MKMVQVLMEALIPVMGFFLWDWSLYFILLFYLMDLLSDLFFANVRSRRTQKENAVLSTRDWIFRSTFTVLILTLIIIGTGFALYHMNPFHSFIGELKAFWTYEEMGIQQGYLLVPLVFLAAYQQYKMDFLMPARYRSTDHQNIWSPYIRAYLFVLGGVFLVMLSTLFIIFDEVVYVLLTVTLSSVYKFWQGEINA